MFAIKYCKQCTRQFSYFRYSLLKFKNSLQPLHKLREGRGMDLSEPPPFAPMYFNKYIASLSEVIYYLEMFINIRHNCAFQENSKIVFLWITSVYLNFRYWNFSRRRKPWLQKHLLHCHLQLSFKENLC